MGIDVCCIGIPELRSVRAMNSTSSSAPFARGVRYILLDELILQAELRVCSEQGITSFQCPCRLYHEGTRYSVKVIREHLRQHRRDQLLMRSMVGTDPPGGWPPNGL
jgi:hypothetical protein